MMHDKDRLFNKENKSFVITHNLKGNRIDRWVKQFKENEEFRKRKRSDSVLLTHEILSWHKEDTKNISLEKMEKITNEYIQKRNPNGIYVAVPHFDKNHYHIHICASGVEYRTGKSLRMSKIGFQKLKRDIQNYQVEHFPELSNSIVAHGKKEKSLQAEKEYQYKMRTGRETEKELLVGILEICYKSAQSEADFFKKLKEQKLKTYNRNGKMTGVFFRNHKFRFNRLGFTNKRFEELDKSLKREKELDETREKNGRTIALNR
jgi:hypothetical protein